MNVLAVSNPFGAPVYYRETVDSTMNACRGLAANGALSGTVIAAGTQENGRGRQGRAWHSPAGSALLFTVFREYAGFAEIPRAFTLKTGLAAAEAIAEALPCLADRVYVKWPNDVMLVPFAPALPAKKIAGILVETDGGKTYTGIGVNLFQTDFPQPIAEKAGSLLSFFLEEFPGRAFPPELSCGSLLEKILGRLAVWLPAPGLPGPADWKQRLEARLFKRGETVIFAEGPPDTPRLVHGTLAGIDDDGALLLTPAGRAGSLSFSAGELRVY